MIDFKTICSQADNFILWANAIFFSAFLFVQSLFYLLKDIKRIKEKSILEIYGNSTKYNKNISIVDLIDNLYKESKVLVLPAERNDIHFKLSMISYFIIGVIAIFNKPLSGTLGLSPNTFYIIYLPFLGYGISFLFYKFILFRNYYHLQKKYLDSESLNSNIAFVDINESEKYKNIS